MPGLARRRRLRRRRPRVVFELLFRRPRVAPRAPAVEAAEAQEIGCERWDPGYWVARACADESGARARTLPLKNGGGAGGEAPQELRDMKQNVACALAPSNHRLKLAVHVPSEPSEMNDPLSSHSEKRDRQKRGTSVSKTCHGLDDLHAPTSCGRSARRRPPE